MPSPVKPIPDGYHSVTPYLVVKDARGALAFYARAFGATELFRLEQPDGRVGHAELQLGDSRVMLADEFPEMGARSPASLGGTAVSLLLYVKDVDAVVAAAVSAGATLSRPVANQFYGDRTGAVTDRLRARMVRLDPRRGRLARGAGAPERGAGEALKAFPSRRPPTILGHPWVRLATGLPMLSRCRE
jgi:PhnB protein